jgi:signal peptidase II
MSPDAKRPSPQTTAEEHTFKWDNFRVPPAVLLFALTAVLGVAADLLTKHWAYTALVYDARDVAGSTQFLSRTHELVPGWLHLRFTGNEGAVFGIGQGRRTLFVIVSVGAVAFLAYLFGTSGRRQRFYHFVLGMLLAGVLGNLYDRMVYGYVRDMIYALPDWAWPGTWQVPFINYPGNPHREVFPWIFNVADVMLCTGVGLMLAHQVILWLRGPRERPAALKPVES